MDIHNIGRRICDEIAGVIAAVDDDAVGELIQSLLVARRVFLTGVGRSGWVARCLATRLMHLDRTVHVVGDASTPKIGDGDLLMACTGSGETPTILAHVEAARRAGADLAVITACPDGAAARQARVVIHLSAPTPKAHDSDGPESIQPMGSLFEQSLLIFGDALIMLLAQRLEQDHPQMWQRHTNLE